MKIHDSIALLGVFMIVIASFMIGLLIGLIVTGAFCIIIGLMLARTYQENPPSKGGEN